MSRYLSLFSGQAIFSESSIKDLVKVIFRELKMPKSLDALSG